MPEVSKIEIVGLKDLTKCLEHLPQEVNASGIRNVARKPANKIVSLARKLFTYKDTGVTKKSFGILKVKDQKQTFLEIGVKGRSLAWIFMLGAKNRQKKSGAGTGDIAPIGNVIQKAAGDIGKSGLSEMEVDLTKAIAKAVRKYGFR